MNIREHELRIELRCTEGAVLRALGLVERRGFRLRTCQLHAESGDRRVLDIVVESVRPADLLKRQLERLHDVLSVHNRSYVQGPGVTRLDRPALA